MSCAGRSVRLGGVAVGFVGLLRGGGMIALVVILGRGAVRLCRLGQSEVAAYSHFRPRPKILSTGQGPAGLADGTK
jgi:hypothetical protein